MAAHLAALEARVCLVTNVMEIERDRAGVTVESLDPIHGLVLPAPDAAWDWTLASFGEAARDRETIHRVHAYRDWGATCRAARWSAT